MTMKIARIASMSHPVPPHGYGGTQRSMAQMTVFQALSCGHQISLYAPADSTIIAFAQSIAAQMGDEASVSDDGKTITFPRNNGAITLRTTGHTSLGDGRHPGAYRANKALVDLLATDDAKSHFDIVHVHRRALVHELTQHGLRRKIVVHEHSPDLGDAADFSDHPPIIAISNDQAELLRTKYNANILGVAYHGLDPFCLAGTTAQAGYLVSIGRFTPFKGQARAIAIARAAGRPLLLAGSVTDDRYKEYADTEVLPHVDVHDEGLLNRMKDMTAEEVRKEIARLGQNARHPEAPIIYVGVVDDEQKQALFGFAAATLFPISWAEPFGRVLIESLAAGTPVIGYERLGSVTTGSVNEIISPWRTGFLVTAENERMGIERAAACVGAAERLDRAHIRQHFEEKWSSVGNARRLDRLYRRHLGLPQHPQMRLLEEPRLQPTMESTRYEQ